MEKAKVLFVCIHNSARSQMAEELLRKIAGDECEVESAGIVHWSFPDPSGFTGIYKEQKAKIRSLKEEIKKRIQTWLAE